MFEDDKEPEFFESKFTDEKGNEFSFDEMMAGVAQKHANKLAQDPEWTDKIHIHKHSLVEAFAQGILSSYPWYKGYQLPENFETVMNRMSILLQEEFSGGNLEVVQVGLLKLRGVYKRLAMSIPEYVAWNDIPGGSRIVTRYDDVANEPSFIDIDVPPHNAVIFLRDRERDYKRFNEEFERKY